MSKQLVRIEPAFEAEIVEMRAGAITVDYVDVLPESEAGVSTPLDEAEEEALEQGIASVFESLMAETAEGDAEPTLALLAELNRLWASPLAA